MADPITLALIGVVGSTAMNAIGSIAQGNAANAAAQANANALTQQAEAESRAANAREEAQRRQNRQFLGAQRAALAQAGIGLNGSAYDVARQSAINAELDALNIRYEGQLAAKGLRDQATIQRFEGRQAKTAGYLGAGAALLQGTANYAGIKTGAAKPAKVYRAPPAPRKF
jgi:hypothetical protein